jgi:hypothetical protein
VIGEATVISKFSRRSDLRVLDMPIKFPYQADYRLPQELDQFDEVLAKMISYEHRINPSVNQYFAYLTVDQMSVAEGNYQRVPGLHCDGFQGARVYDKKPCSRSYIVYDLTPPIFYPQSFNTNHLNEKTDNFFLSFDEQADEEAAITFDPYQILLMNAYTVHAASKAEHNQYRTFVRLSYDTQIYNRLGNTHNPMFNYKWPMVSSDVLGKLKHKPLPKLDFWNTIMAGLEEI